MSETKEQLRELYEADLRTIITRWNGTEGPRVKKPSAYERIPEPESTREIDFTRDMVWVTSDFHFSHHNIIRFSNRPFANTEEMDEALIGNYNEYVQPNDVCIWVGDVSFCGIEKTREYVDRCNGYKILVVGNHDIKKKVVPDMGFDEVHLLYHLKPKVGDLVFTHYPMYNLPKNMINIHGHLHRGGEINSTQHINVNCEFHQYRPLSLRTICYWAAHRLSKLGVDK